MAEQEKIFLNIGRDDEGYLKIWTSKYLIIGKDLNEIDFEEGVKPFDKFMNALNQYLRGTRFPNSELEEVAEAREKLYDALKSIIKN